MPASEPEPVDPELVDAAIRRGLAAALRTHPGATLNTLSRVDLASVEQSAANGGEALLGVIALDVPGGSVSYSVRWRPTTNAGRLVREWW